MTSIIVFSFYMYIKMRASKIIIKIGAQKQMTSFGFGCKFHDIKYFELDFLCISLEVIIHLRSSSIIL